VTNTQRPEWKFTWTNNPTISLCGLKNWGYDNLNV